MDKMKLRQDINKLDSGYCGMIIDSKDGKDLEYLQGCLVATNIVADKCLDDTDLEVDVGTLVTWTTEMCKEYPDDLFFAGKRDGLKQCLVLITGGRYDG